MLGWIDGVKVALGNKGMTVEAARQCAKDRKQWTIIIIIIIIISLERIDNINLRHR